MLKMRANERPYFALWRTRGGFMLRSAKGIPPVFVSDRDFAVRVFARV